MTGFERLRARLVREYEKKTPGSRAIFRRAQKVMIAGGSHTIRLWRPYPFFAGAAEGPRVRDVDGNLYIDYWQGHYANILGHNPRLIRRRTAASLARRPSSGGSGAGTRKSVSRPRARWRPCTPLCWPRA